MICAGVSEILYPGGTFGENSCIVCTDLSLTYAPVVILHSILIMFTLIMFIREVDSYHLLGCNNLDVNPSIDPMVFGLSNFYPISAIDFSPHGIVILSKR